MIDISIRYNSKADREKQISHVITYPDGVQRVLTMKRYQWDWVPLAEENGYGCQDILREAMGLARNFPSAHGYQHDVLDSTKYMLWVINGMIQNSQNRFANDVSK